MGQNYLYRPLAPHTFLDYLIFAVDDAFVAGAAAPKGRKLGHAGAIVNSGAETADAKKEALKSAGVEVAETITKIGEAMKISMGVS